MIVIVDSLWETPPAQRTDKIQTGLGLNGMYYETPAFEFNMFMSILYYFKQVFPTICTQYGVYNGGQDVKIITEYPRDLKTLVMPTIVVRQVTTDELEITSGGMLGVKETQQGEVEVEFDLYYRERTMNVQFDLCSATKRDRLLLKSIISDTLIKMGRMTMKNFMSTAQTVPDMTLGEMIKNDNDGYTRNITHDDIQYLSVTRTTFSAKEYFVPYPDLVDLGDIHVTQYINEVIDANKMEFDI